MPLHLLSKKSWNVYNPASIARVRADETAAAAREEAEEQKAHEYDAARRLAILRGVTPPPRPAPLESFDDEKNRSRGENQDPGDEDSGARKRARDAEHDARRKKRRLAGEDDTDRDIRLAREDLGGGRSAAREQREHRGSLVKHGGAQAASQPRDGVDRDAPIVDHAGHIQLFSAPDTRALRAAKNAEAEADKQRAARDASDLTTLKFANAAGFKKDARSRPWYASSRASVGYTGTEEVEDKVLKDAFGNEDAGRARRDVGRVEAADPLAAMKVAQARLKEVERERERWNLERERELEELRELQEREERRRRRRNERRSRDGTQDELDGFSLDDPALDANKRRRRRSRSRSRSRDRSDRSRNGHGHRRKDRSRSRSRSRERHHHSRRHRRHSRE